MYEAAYDRIQGRLISDWEVSLVDDETALSFEARRLEERYHAPEFKIEGDRIYSDFSSLVAMDWGCLWEGRPVVESGAEHVPSGSGDWPIVCVEAPRIKGWNADAIASFARNYGPLFEHGGAPISEQIGEWAQAAYVMNLAMRLAAVVEGGADYGELEGFVDFRLLSSMNGAGVDLDVVIGERLVGRYADFLSVSRPEYLRLFPDKCLMGPMFVHTPWLNPGDKYTGEGTDFFKETCSLYARGDRVVHPTMGTIVYNRGIKSERHDRERYPISWLEGVGTAAKGEIDFALREALHALINLHTRNVRFGWVEGVYAPRFTCLLDRVWHSFALSLSTAKLGICERCGDVFASTQGKMHCDPCQGKVRQERGYTNKLAREHIPAICVEAEDAEDAYGRLLSLMKAKRRVTARNIYRFELEWRKLIANEFEAMGEG